MHSFCGRFHIRTPRSRLRGRTLHPCCLSLAAPGGGSWDTTSVTACPAERSGTRRPPDVTGLVRLAWAAEARDAGADETSQDRQQVLGLVARAAAAWAACCWACRSSATAMAMATRFATSAAENMVPSPAIPPVIARSRAAPRNWFPSLVGRGIRPCYARAARSQLSAARRSTRLSRARAAECRVSAAAHAASAARPGSCRERWRMCSAAMRPGGPSTRRSRPVPPR
jgi:hypothetical protein